MMWDDVPFEERAAFMKDNVMEPSAELQRAFAPATWPGFGHFRQLLLEIYGTPGAFPGEGPLERFHALSYSTQLFFSALASAGEPVEDGGGLRVEKAAFKQLYKKPSPAPFEVLPGFGVEFAYTKKGAAAALYAVCDAFTVRFSQREGIPAALKEMARHFAEVDHKAEYAEALVMLGKADYDRLVLGRPAIREDIDPLRPDILRSTGGLAPLYREVIARARGLGYSTVSYMQRYANPTWNINVVEGKKLRLKSVWCEGRGFVHLPVPYERAGEVIRDRRRYHPGVQAAIERFGCVKCGRCQAGKKVQFQKVDGITVCNGHGESCTVFMELQNMDEVSSLLGLMEGLAKKTV